MRERVLLDYTHQDRPLGEASLKHPGKVPQSNRSYFLLIPEPARYDTF